MAGGRDAVINYGLHNNHDFPALFPDVQSAILSMFPDKGAYKYYVCLMDMIDINPTVQMNEQMKRKVLEHLDEREKYFRSLCRFFGIWCIR